MIFIDIYHSVIVVGIVYGYNYRRKGENMNISDGRGRNTKKMGEKNRLNVKAWFKKNPGSTINECCNGLNLTYKTVRGHIDSINKDKS